MPVVVFGENGLPLLSRDKIQIFSLYTLAIWVEVMPIPLNLCWKRFQGFSCDPFGRPSSSTTPKLPAATQGRPAGSPADSCEPERGIESDDEALPAAQPEPDGRVIRNDKEAPALPPSPTSDRRGSSLLKPECVLKGIDEAQTAKPEGVLELCDVDPTAPEPDRFSLFLDIDLR